MLRNNSKETKKECQENWNTPFESKLNKEEEFWFIRWIFMRRKYKNALLEIERLKNLEVAKLQVENERLESLLIQLRTDMFPENKTKRKYKKKK